jgi:transcription initiation factor IIE alpha subunit
MLSIYLLFSKMYSVIERNLFILKNHTTIGQMPKRSLPRSVLSPEKAFIAAGIESAIRGMDLKNFISNSILQNISESTLEILEGELDNKDLISKMKLTQIDLLLHEYINNIGKDTANILEIARPTSVFPITVNEKMLTSAKIIQPSQPDIESSKEMSRASNASDSKQFTNSPPMNSKRLMPTAAEIIPASQIIIESQDNTNLVNNALISNRSLAQTPQEVSALTSVEFTEVRDILEKLYAEGEIERRERGDEFEYWKPSKAHNITWQIYGIMTNDPTKAQNPEEISKLVPGTNRDSVKAVLYWLLKEGWVKRKHRENSDDKRRSSWVYWKPNTSIPLLRNSIDVDKLLENLPRQKRQAVSVRLLSSKLDAPASTVRDAMNRLESAGRIKSVRVLNDRNIFEARYYRVTSRRQLQKD